MRKRCFKEKGIPLNCYTSFAMTAYFLPGILQYRQQSYLSCRERSVSDDDDIPTEYKGNKDGRKGTHKHQSCPFYLLNY